jgi:hypothetical protein
MHRGITYAGFLLGMFTLVGHLGAQTSDEPEPAKVAISDGILQQIPSGIPRGGRETSSDGKCGGSAEDLKADDNVSGCSACTGVERDVDQS